MKERLIPKLPLVSMIVTGIVSIYFFLLAFINYSFLMSGQFTGIIPSFVLFGESTKPGLLVFTVSSSWLIIGWLISTKFKRFQTRGWRNAWFWNMFFGITIHYLWLISAPVYNKLLPYLGQRIVNMDNTNIWQAVAIGNTNTLMIIIMFIPSAVSFMLLVWLAGQYSQYSEEIKKAFGEFEFANLLLQKWFKLGNTEHWPDVILGHDSDTNEVLIQPGRDRTLNNIIIGSIGTGKTAALVLPIVNQDLHWMSKFINAYPKIYNRENYHTEEVLGMYLNGISIIEPSNDLCQKAYQLVLAHGIPKESVFYIDPTNPETPSINPMQGPVDKVAEAFAMVIQGLAEGGNSNFFFEQSERNHLKHYIYLLKLHEPEQEVTFDMLLNMYNNSQLVRRMHLSLKKTIPKDIEQIEDRDERNHWAIVRQIDEWFDNNLIPKLERNGGQMTPEIVKHGDYYGEEVYYDAKAEYVQGLRNVLNDIGASPLIRRVLFGKSDFDFDRHLEMGGVLLVNTAKGELQGLSNIFGKLILLSLQNAVFRRTPNSSSFHHILVDEFPDYVYRPFREFPAQSRKYKTIVTVVAQTITQLADTYGETYMHTLLGTLRHKMVYGDIPDFDAQLFSKIFGEKETFEEGRTEQAVSPLQENPMLRMGSNYQKKKEAILSPSDIIYQEPFQCAVKIVANNKPVPVRQINANFVPKPEFKVATIKVDEQAALLWIENRNTMESRSLTLVNDFDEEQVTPNISETEKIVRHDEPLVAYPTVQQPIEYLFDSSDEEAQPVIQLDQKEIGSQSVVIERDLEKTDKQLEVTSLDNIQSESDEPETFDWGTSFTQTEKVTTSPASTSEIGEEETELFNEMQKELAKVSPDKEASKSFYSDL